MNHGKLYNIDLLLDDFSFYSKYTRTVVYNAGEADAIDRSVYVTNSSMALLAEQLHGVVIVMEHRCYGESQLGTVWIFHLYNN